MTREKFGNYSVTFKVDGPVVLFKVYNNKDNDKSGSCLEGFFSWTGSWKDQLCFNKKAYKGDELRNIASLYDEQIIPKCKDLIKNKYPNICSND